MNLDDQSDESPVVDSFFCSACVVNKCIDRHDQQVLMFLGIHFSVFTTGCLDDAKKKEKKNHISMHVCCKQTAAKQIKWLTVNNIVSPQENIHIDLDPTAGFV